MNVLIDGKEYIYFIDAGYIPAVLRKVKRSDGGALNFLKDKARDYRRVDDGDNLEISS
jgi:hypothetical protein